MIQLDQSIWVFDGGNVDFYGFPYPTRMVVIRLKSGDLWIWSPIHLTSELKEKLKSIEGEVRHLVSPNRIHHLFLGEWKEAYPDARLWAVDSTIRKRKDLVFEAALEKGVPTEWRGEIDQFWFHGSPIFDEMCFYHRESKTAIFADLSENFSDTFLNKYWSKWKIKIARVWKITEPYGFAPLELRLSWIRKSEDRKMMRQLIEERPERVVMAHGKVQMDAGDAYLKKAFQWML